MADSCLITNRRQLLIGISVSTFLPLSTIHPEPAEGLSPNGIVEADPALFAYGRLMEIEKVLLDVPADKDDSSYLSLVRTLEQTENRLVTSRALSPNGIHAKLDRMASICAWEPERAIRGCPLVHSVVANFARVMNSSSVTP